MVQSQNICQFEGNDSIVASYLSEPHCSCCDNSESADSNYDQDLESEAAIPVLEMNNFTQYNNWSERKYCQSPPSWYEEYTPRVSDPRQSKVNRITIRRDNRLMMTESLPILLVSNLRSLWPKLNSFKDDMILRDILCAMLSEVWGKRKLQKATV